MRRTFPRSRPALVGAAGFALALLLIASTARGQAPSDAASSMARYVPRDNLVIYVEYDGLDAHADAWRKTAAYKILNTTTTGLMLEDLFVQLVGKIYPSSAEGPDLLAILKHAARSGFVYAIGVDPATGKAGFSMLVLRDGFKNKDLRPRLARGLQSMYAPNKPQQVVRAGHKVVSGKNKADLTLNWWVEESKKEDIVIVGPTPEAADLILETLDGKKPSAFEHPLRAELAKPEAGFVGTGLAFLDPAVLKARNLPPSLGLSEITRFDLRWGFQDDALVNITRIGSPSPRKGLLALLDGPTFNKKSLPPLPESLTGYSVMSMDLKTSMDRLVALAKTFKPDADTQVNQAIDAIKTKTKLRLREDILSHLGPKVAWYVVPGKAGAATAPSGGPNMMSLMMAGAGIDQIPRLAIVMDIDNAVAFGKVLDELMVYANRELKAQAPGGAGAEAPGRGNRNRAPSGPTLEFRLGTGDVKSYTLSVPPEMSSTIPPTFRPTVRVGPKNVVIAVSPDLAKLALEAKGSWTPPNELAGAFLGLSDKMRFLSVDDPRDTTPAVLASLPAKLQQGINAAILKALPSGTPPGATPPAAAPGSEAGGPGPRGRSRGGEMAVGGSEAGSLPGAVPPGQPGPGGPPGQPQTIVLQVDAAKLPSADAIKGLLFPSVTSAEVTDDGLRIVVRQAFPALGDPSRVGMAPAAFGAASARARAIGRPDGAPSAPAIIPPRPAPEPGRGAGPGSGRSGSSEPK